jgi:glycosyltransferase involved in cell wall biosynthesis
MKRDLDALVQENQELHSALLRYEELPFALHTTAQLLARRVRGRLAARRRARRMPAPSPPHVAPYVARPAPPHSGHRPRVLHAVGNLYTGGSARLVVDLAERLNDAHEHVAIVRDTPPTPHYEGIEVERLEGFRNARAAEAVLDRLRPQFVHVHFLGHHRNDYCELDWRWYERVFQAATAREVPVVENVAPAGDVGALATTVVALLEDRERAARVGAANEVRAQELFSVEKMVDAYRRLYADVISGS